MQSRSNSTQNISPSKRARIEESTDRPAGRKRNSNKSPENEDNPALLDEEKVPDDIEAIVAMQYSDTNPSIPRSSGGFNEMKTFNGQH